MANFIEWANANNGFAMLILTFASVFTTFVMAGFSWQANSLSAKNISQAFEIEHARNRPYLIFEIEHRKSFVYAVLKNIGQTGAFNVTVSTIPKLEGKLGNPNPRQTALTSRQITFVAPGRELSDVIAPGHEFYKTYSEPKFNGKIEYEDSAGDRYVEQISLDLTYLVELVNFGEPDVAKETEKLVREVRDISNSISSARRQLEFWMKSENEKTPRSDQS